jgi:hypothetical protein
MVMRLNASALTGKFLVNSALRVASAMVLAFVAGEVGLFRFAATPGQRYGVYFLLGMFPSWAMRALRDRARTFFQADEEGCETLPLCLIDGLDDGIAERLSELGAWDIQHLATSQPDELIMKTLYPPKRVVDWIDQAILITYVRRKITAFRALGIRGAIDLAVVYGDAFGLFPNAVEPPDSRKQRAQELLKALTQQSGLSDSALTMIGRSLFEDEQVNLIWNLWFT